MFSFLRVEKDPEAHRATGPRVAASRRSLRGMAGRAGRLRRQTDAARLGPAGQSLLFGLGFSLHEVPFGVEDASCQATALTGYNAFTSLSIALSEANHAAPSPIFSVPPS
jgi:hypothetical protein